MKPEGQAIAVSLAREEGAAVARVRDEGIGAQAAKGGFDRSFPGSAAAAAATLPARGGGEPS